MNDTIKNIIFIAIAIFLAIIAVKFVMWLLPIILIAIVAYIIYDRLKKPKQEEVIIIKKKRKK